MFSRTIYNVLRTSYGSTRTFHKLRIVPQFTPTGNSLWVKTSYLPENLNPIIHKRYKSKRKASNIEEEEEDDAQLEIDDYLRTKNSKTIETTVPSLRLDVVAKVGFGISRNKVDKEFYNSNIRVNGERLLKKGSMVKEDDEIDLVTGRSPKTSEFLVVHRCVLLSAKADPDEEGIRVKLLRNKSLLIEDYKDRWNGVKE